MEVKIYIIEIYILIANSAKSLNVNSTSGTINWQNRSFYKPKQYSSFAGKC